MKTVLFSASHSVQKFFRMFSVLVLIFLFLRQCQSNLINVKGLFTPFYTLIISFKRYSKSIKRDIFCLDFRSNFLVSISFRKGNVPAGVP